MTALFIALTALLVLVNAFFVIAEYALVRSRRPRLETMADEPGADEVILSGGSGRGLSCRLLASAGEGEEGCKLLAGRTRLRTPRTGARVEQSHVRTGAVV